MESEYNKGSRMLPNNRHESGDFATAERKSTRAGGKQMSLLKPLN